MNKTLSKILKSMTREEFIMDCEKAPFTKFKINCPSQLNLEENLKICDECGCKECWKNAIKNIKFKEEK